MKQSLLFGTGLVALLSTVALVCLTMVHAVHIAVGSVQRTTSLISGSLEAIVCVMLVFFIATTLLSSLAPFLKRLPPTYLSIFFVCAALACVIAAAASVASIACLGGAAQGEAPDATERTFVIALSLMLAVTVVCQAGFLIAHYLHCRHATLDGADSLFTDDSSRSSPKLKVKAIRYSRTRPSLAENRGTESMDSVDMHSLDSRRWPGQTQPSHPPARSLSHTVRPTTSQTRLLPSRGTQHTLRTLDSCASLSTVGDFNDGWDSSSAFSRTTAPDQVPLPATGRHRFLETIPASPNAKALAGLEPPAPARKRGRSFSPVPRGRRPGQRSPPPPLPSEELHIHPLFRSDSPNPPPMVTPGTSVRAAPDAGKVIHHHPSLHSLRRLGSSSATSLTSSPLSRKSSFETSSLRKPTDEQGSIIEVDEATAAEPVPPIPDFVLGAGRRSSLTRYNSRKQENEEDAPQK